MLTLLQRRRNTCAVKVARLESRCVESDFCWITIHHNKGILYCIALVVASYVLLIYCIVYSALRCAMHQPQWWRYTNLLLRASYISSYYKWLIFCYLVGTGAHTQISFMCILYHLNKCSSWYQISLTTFMESIQMICIYGKEKVCPTFGILDSCQHLHGDILGLPGSKRFTTAL